MAYASVTYTSASGTTFALTNSNGDPIEYLRQADIAVTVNGVVQTLTTDYTFNTAGTAIVLNTAVTSATVVLTRTTSITDATVSFTAGSTLTAQDLNNSDKQNRFALQEFSDTYGALTTGSGDLSALAGFIGSSETWLSDNAHAPTTGATDVRIDSKIDAALTTDVIAGTDISITDNSPSSGQITIAHNVAGANTTVNNSDGTVLQDITVTAQGHVTSVGSYNLDNRYYTETEADAKYVDFTSTQIISGAKTFSFSPVIPTPTLSNHAVTKSYVDAFIAAGVTDGDKGDITVSGTGTVFTIDNDAVVTSKINNGAVTPAKLSTGGPTWTSGGLLSTNNLSINNATPTFTSDGLSFTDSVPISSSYANRISLGASGGVVKYGFGVSSQVVHYVSDTRHNFYNFVGPTIQKVAQLDDRLMLGGPNTYAFADATRLVVQGNSANDSTDAVVDLMRGSYASTGDTLGSIRFRDTYSSPQSYYASIACRAEAGPTTASYLGSLTFSTNTTGSVSPIERMRIDSSGRMLVGTSTSRTIAGDQGSIQLETAGISRASLTTNAASTAGAFLNIAKSRGTSLNSKTVVASGDDIGGINFFGADGTNDVQAASITAAIDGTPGTNDMPGRLVFSTTADGASSPTERMRITSDGYFKASNNSTYSTASPDYHQFNQNAASQWALGVFNRHASQPFGVTIQYLNATPNGTTNSFLLCGDSTTDRLQVRSNGGIANYSANNVNLSDINTKKDISLAAGTWDCLKEWEIVNFRYKDQPDDADLNMGVIAQQVAESCPEVITVFEEAKDDQPEKLGIKEQQMYWMAIKALQEAQVRIEALEADVAQLKGA